MDRRANLMPRELIASAPQAAGDIEPVAAGGEDGPWHVNGRYYAREADAAMWRRVLAERGRLETETLQRCESRYTTGVQLLARRLVRAGKWDQVSNGHEYHPWWAWGDILSKDHGGPNGEPVLLVIDRAGSIVGGPYYVDYRSRPNDLVSMHWDAVDGLLLNPRRPNRKVC